MTIEQTVEIPANRRITLDVPPGIPEGKARISLTITGISPAQTPEKTRQSWADFKKNFCPYKEADGLAVDRFLEMKRADKALEDEQDAQRFRESLDRMCLNRSTFTDPSSKQLEPLMGIAEGSSFTVERLLEERRKEG
jgi:hypothetical protein